MPAAEGKMSRRPGRDTRTGEIVEWNTAPVNTFSIVRAGAVLNR